MSEIEQPIPLSSPDGRLFAYACPRCLYPKSNISGGTFDDRLQHSLEDAARCCICHGCGIVLENYWTTRCPACEVKERERFAAHLEATRPEREAAEAAYEAALSKAKDADLAGCLKRTMSDISEDYYCAGWLHGLEFELWRMIQGGDRHFGMGEVTESEVAELKRLSENAGGWWFWDDNHGELFTTTEEWLLRLQGNA